MKRIKKKVSKLFVLFFIIGALIGLGTSYMITKDDCFILNGSKEVVLELNGTYLEQGVKVISFGKDVSKDVRIVIYDVNDEEVENVDSSLENEYTIVYTIENVKYSNYKLIRVVKVGDDNA